MLNLIWIFRGLFRFPIENLFKYSDYFYFNLSKQSFYEISNYLNNKYNIINNKSRDKDSISFKKVINIQSVGHYNKSLLEKWLIQKTEAEFILYFDDQAPDYLTFNVYSNNDLMTKYSKTYPIRIAIFTENVYPDLNYADYAIAFFHINSKNDNLQKNSYFINN